MQHYLRVIISLSFPSGPLQCKITPLSCVHALRIFLLRHVTRTVLFMQCRTPSVASYCHLYKYILWPHLSSLVCCFVHWVCLLLFPPVVPGVPGVAFPLAYFRGEDEPGCLGSLGRFLLPVPDCSPKASLHPALSESPTSQDAEPTLPFLPSVDRTQCLLLLYTMTSLRP